MRNILVPLSVLLVLIVMACNVDSLSNMVAARILIMTGAMDYTSGSGSYYGKKLVEDTRSASDPQIKVLMQ